VVPDDAIPIASSQHHQPQWLLTQAAGQGPVAMAALPRPDDEPLWRSRLARLARYRNIGPTEIRGPHRKQLGTAPAAGWASSQNTGRLTRLLSHRRGNPPSHRHPIHFNKLCPSRPLKLRQERKNPSVQSAIRVVLRVLCSWWCWA